jgi:ketosteroid isomerase-like protein
MVKYLTLTLAATLLIITSCNPGGENTGAKEELIQRDIEFSEYAQENGMRKAFVQYADSAAVLLKPDRMPVKGLKSIAYFYATVNEDNLDFSWMPLDATVSGSEDLGYTYGVWQASLKDSVSNGTYVTIWKKNDDGEWLYVLDSGNEGIGPME